jgi:tryptophanyl-tRNA synthetase
MQEQTDMKRKLAAAVAALMEQMEERAQQQAEKDQRLLDKLAAKGRAG